MKKYCKYCGEHLVDGQTHDCPKLKFVTKIKQFFVNLLNKTGIENSQISKIESFERGKSIVPDSVTPDEGEITVKQYDIALLRSRFKRNFAEGCMQVTNKRLLFRGAGHTLQGPTTYQCEFSMDKIDGVVICKDYKFQWFDLIVNLFITYVVTAFAVLVGLGLNESGSGFLATCFIFLGIGSCIPFFVVYKRYLLKAIILAAGSGIVGSVLVVANNYKDKAMMSFSIIVLSVILVLYWVAMFMSFFQQNLYIEIQTSGGSPSIQVGEEWCGFSEVLPGKDTDLAIKELGAIINDIKTLGDMGIEKWQAK